MLTFVRSKKKSLIIKLAFAIIILSFVIGYAMLSSPGGPGGDVPTGEAATVNGRNIAYQDFQTTYSNLYQLYQNIYQDQFTPALENQLKLADKAINGLIDQVLLQEEAERQKLEISKKELVDAIAKVEAFQENGVFSKARYLEVLAYQRMTAEEFETLQRGELLMNKVREQLQAGVAVSDADVEEEFTKDNEKVNLSFVSLVPAAFEKAVKISDKELEAFFGSEQEVFRIADTVSLRYLQFQPQRYHDQVTFDESELERYYRRHLDQFEILESIKASHILVKVEADASEETREKKRAYASKLLDEIRAGKDFAEVARTSSDDKASAVNGGNLGYFSRGSMVKPFEEAAFSLKPGEVSNLVETIFGYHIIKVEAYIEPGIRTLADAMDEVKEGLRAEKAKQLAFEKAMDAYNINRKSGDLQAAAATNELGLKETGPFARDGYIDGIGPNAEIINAALLLEDQQLARPVVTDDGVILFGLKERIPSHIPELAEVRDLVIAAYRAKESANLAKAAAEEIVAGLTVGGNLAKLAQKAGLSVEETGPFSRTYAPFVPRIGNSEELSTAAFSQPADQPGIARVFEVQKRFVVAAVKERLAADLTSLDTAKREELHKALLSRWQNEAVQKRLSELREGANIVIVPSVQALLNKEK